MCFFSTKHILPAYKLNMACTLPQQPSFHRQRTLCVLHIARPQYIVQHTGNPVFHIFCFFCVHPVFLFAYSNRFYRKHQSMYIFSSRYFLFTMPVICMNSPASSTRFLLFFLWGISSTLWYVNRRVSV